MLSATPGIAAPAATATKPPIKAYSIRSWPGLSRRAGKINILVCIFSLLCPGLRALRLSVPATNRPKERFGWRPLRLKEIRKLRPDLRVALRLPA